MVPRGLWAFVIAMAALSAGRAAESPPNIILVLADDLGYAELGCQGCRDIPTPHIDSLAKHGVRCTAGYVTAPFCSPSRAGLLTGRYQQRFGYEFNTPPPEQDQPHIGLPLTESTIADRLKAAGYRTGLVGKWHQGLNPKFHPLKRGFDEFFGFAREGHFYADVQAPDIISRLRKNEPDYDKQNPIRRGLDEVEEKEYLTRAFNREAVAFIDRNHERPFFLYLSYSAVHSPMQTTRADYDRFPKLDDQQRRIFAGMLAAMDDGVGQVLAKLRERKLEENTLIVFLSDNGGPTVELTSRNDPFRGGKGQVYEGGVRIPFIWQWQGKLPAGKVDDRPISSLDILPTVLAAAGQKPPAGLDGVNLLPYLRGENQDNPHARLCWRMGGRTALREGKWKLVREGSQPAELYDLDADPGEQKNLAADQSAVVQRLLDEWKRWNAGLLPPLWGGKK